MHQAIAFAIVDHLEPKDALIVHPLLILLNLFILLRLSKIEGIRLNVLSLYLVS